MLKRTLIVLILLQFYSPLAQGSAWHVSKVELEGNRRTRDAWVVEYLGLHFPTYLDEDEIAALRQKLLTTSVFTSVSTSLEDSKTEPGMYTLRITLEEKWTTIPVIRGTYGGGTPLKVGGIYDTHVFGSLWTLGLEGRQYGQAPVGGVIWARAPRWITGKHAVGAEGWREFRERSVYDDKAKVLGTVRTSSAAGRGQLLAPLSLWSNSTNWQIGLDARIRRDEPSEFNPNDEYSGLVPDSVVLPASLSNTTSLFPTLVYDDVRIENLDMNGVRMVALGGPVLTEEGYFGKGELDLFGYWDAGSHLNFAAHLFYGQTNLDRFQDRYFLGGFDSVRGYPDGITFGSRIVFLNAEIRKITTKFKYLWVQNVVFADVGVAEDDWGRSRRAMRESAGLGVRLAIPQIYRMMFRIDYAWALDGSGARGVTAGLSQFFDPYKPL